jgi:hypothetical protein
MRFAGKLIYKGQVILDPATGDLWETMIVGVPAWGGHFDPTDAFGTGSDYELVLNAVDAATSYWALFLLS